MSAYKILDNMSLEEIKELAKRCKYEIDKREDADRCNLHNVPNDVLDSLAAQNREKNQPLIVKLLVERDVEVFKFCEGDEYVAFLDDGHAVPKALHNDEINSAIKESSRITTELCGLVDEVANKYQVDSENLWCWLDRNS